MNPKLKKLVEKAPQGPGIYKFLDKKELVLYVGKAKSLRKRLQSYVRLSAKHGVKTKNMLEAAESVEWVETNSELEALILEDNLIKELQPMARPYFQKHTNLPELPVHQSNRTEGISGSSDRPSY